MLKMNIVQLGIRVCAGGVAVRAAEVRETADQVRITVKFLTFAIAEIKVGKV